MSEPRGNSHSSQSRLREQFVDDAAGFRDQWNRAAGLVGQEEMRVDTEHFQELCRTVAYAIDPAQTAYNFAVHYGITDLPTPEEIWRVGILPD